MHYHADSRPRQSNGVPMLMDDQGRGICALPSLSILPADSGGWLLTVVIPIAYNQFAQRHIETADPIPLLDEYAADPEATLAKYFGWHYASPIPQQPVSLSDLGL